MLKTETRATFYPYQRYENALRVYRSGEGESSLSVWERKILDILRVRKKFKERYANNYLKYFEDKYPLYASLITAFEDDRVGGDRDILEAVILTSLDTEKIDKSWKHPRFDAAFIELYRTLFYNVIKILGTPALEFQYIIAPLLSSNTDKLAVGAIWKILALVGGIDLLCRKGFGNAAIKGDDIEYLLQLAGFRHCSTLLQYTAEGKSFFEENPSAALAINTLTTFEGVRGNGRRADYIAELGNIAANNINSLLASEFKLMTLPEQDVAKLVEYDGQFRPDITNTLEYTNHITFIGTEDIDDD